MKINKINIIILPLIIFNWVILCAQKPDPTDYSRRKAKKFAENSARFGDYYTAIDFLEYYVEKKKKDMKALYDLAELYRLTRNYPKAREAYNKVNQKNADKYPLALFYASKMAMQMGDYRVASTGFKMFRKSYRDYNDSREFRKLAVINHIGCDSAYNKKERLLDLTTTHINTSINTPHVELSPIIIDEDKMVYASFRTDEIEYYKLDDPNYKPRVRQFYQARRNGFIWNYTGPWKEIVDIPDSDIGNGAFSPDKERFYFNKCYRNWQGKNICDLYVSRKRVDGKWTDPQRLPEPVNDPNYTSTQPTIGINTRRNSEVIYFVSDRPGGKGGLDIWMTEWNNRYREWREPKNLGSRINTVGDEMTPYYDMKTRSLYFSSDGYPGFGGLDIYKATGEVRKWVQPVNMEYPFNSSADDLYFTMDKKSGLGFYVSNRVGGNNIKHPTCCDDIWYFKWNDYIRVSVMGSVFNHPDNKYVKIINESFNVDYSVSSKKRYTSGIPITLYMHDPHTGQDYIVGKDTTMEDGKFIFENIDFGKEYSLVVNNYGTEDKILKFNTFESKDEDTIKLEEIGVHYIPNKPLKLSVYFDFASSDLTEEAKQELEEKVLKVMLAIPNAVIEISSHTDDIGEESYNLDLSQERADNLVQYLIARGIERDRLIAIGYGESQPIASNMTNEGRALNRRVEMRIVGSIKELNYINE
jgi:outer membrane protein OmpA-like peptidoglycan-associated protein